MIPLPAHGSEHLSDELYRTVVVRVRVNSRSQIIQGELIDTTSTTTTRFRNWQGLMTALSAWLKQSSSPADRSPSK